MPNLTDRLARAFVDHEIDLLRYASSANRNVQRLLSALQAEVVARMARSNLSATATARLQAVLRDTQELISSGYGSIDDLIEKRLAGLVPTEAAIVANTVDNAIGISIMEGTLPRATMAVLYRDTLILGAPSSEWWLRQAASLTFDFAKQIRLGMAQGETNAKLIGRVRALDGIFAQPRRVAEALVRTSVQTVALAARAATLRANADVIKGFQQVSTLDDRTSETCIAYDGASWDLDGNPLTGSPPFVNDGGAADGCPRHWNCRSVLVPLTKTWKDMGIDAAEFKPSMRAAADGAVAAKMTYGDWLKEKSAAQQDDILGPGKAMLFRAGQINVRDLLDQGGRPLSLGELQAKHGIGA